MSKGIIVERNGQNDLIKLSNYLNAYVKKNQEIPSNTTIKKELGFSKEKVKKIMLSVDLSEIALPYRHFLPDIMKILTRRCLNDDCEPRILEMWFQLVASFNFKDQNAVQEQKQTRFNIILNKEKNGQ